MDAFRENVLIKKHYILKKPTLYTISAIEFIDSTKITLSEFPRVYRLFLKAV